MLLKRRIIMLDLCPICKSEKIKVEYDGIIRDGGLGKYTKHPVKMYKCCDCNVIWHEQSKNLEEYYQSDEYRVSLEGSVDENEFYRLHDKESFDKLSYTGMIFRNKNVADIGCGCGAFLDVVSGMSNETIAIEPTQKYREALQRKQYHTYAYAKDAIKDWKDKVDVVLSFDVIEHVDSPTNFLKDVYSLLRTGGEAIIGTPTDCPVMRRLLGEDYERKLLFSTQHLWVFGKENLIRMALEIGFKKDSIDVKYFQRYGLSNVFGWLKSKEPGSLIDDTMITSTIDSTWRKELEAEEIADYIVLYLRK